MHGTKTESVTGHSHAATIVRPTVLVADDEPLLLQTLADNLEDAGFHVVTADSGQAVLRHFAENGTAALVLLDWSIGDLDGPDVLRRLRGAGHQVPVIFFTGHSQAVFEELGLARGAVDFVDKSKGFQILLQRVRLALPTPPAAEIQAGVSGLLFDDNQRDASWRGAPVGLTLSEFAGLKLLAAHAGRDVSYNELYAALCGHSRLEPLTSSQRATVRRAINHIRDKIKLLDPSFAAIENYASFGYRWSEPSR